MSEGEGSNVDADATDANGADADAEYGVVAAGRADVSRVE